MKDSNKKNAKIWFYLAAIILLLGIVVCGYLIIFMGKTIHLENPNRNYLESKEFASKDINLGTSYFYSVLPFLFFTTSVSLLIYSDATQDKPYIIASVINLVSWTFLCIFSIIINSMLWNSWKVGSMLPEIILFGSFFWMIVLTLILSVILTIVGYKKLKTETTSV